jgi:hypothetical protein
VPRLQRLLDYLENGLTELEQAVSQAAGEPTSATAEAQTAARA